MTPPLQKVNMIDEKLRHWRQGDVSCDADMEFVHLADLSSPHTQASSQAAARLPHGVCVQKSVPVLQRIRGVVVLTQTCDIVRTHFRRPYVEIAPLVKLDSETVEQVRRLKRPSFAYVPAMADRCLVADLERIMTVEKAVVANWKRIPGWRADAEGREFGRAIARKRSRFAFPDDFIRSIRRFRDRLVDKHKRKSPEGESLRALREIRIHATPSWHATKVSLAIWFIEESELGNSASGLHSQLKNWVGLVDQAGRFRVESALVCRLDEISARDYVESERLDFDSLSID